MRWDIEHCPQNFNEMALYPELREQLNYYYESGNIPHVILHGDTGTGKSTTAMILARKIKPEFSHHNVYDCGGDKGVADIKNYIVHLKGANSGLQRFFADGSSSTFIFDEFHNISKKHQTMFNIVLETHVANIPVFFCVNDIEKVADPIVSRCRLLRFDVAVILNDKLVMRDVGMTANEWKEELRRVGRIITKDLNYDVDEKLENDVLSNDVNCVDARKFFLSLGEKYEMKLFNANKKKG